MPDLFPRGFPAPTRHPREGGDPASLSGAERHKRARRLRGGDEAGVKDASPPSSWRGPQGRGHPERASPALDCFAPLAMTNVW